MIRFTSEQYRACCDSPAWVAGMIGAQPFADAEAMYLAADEIWLGAGPDDWRAAFAAHPNIGAKRTSGFSAAEQAGVADATAQTLAAIAACNVAYHDRFGFVFLICATGKSADEMLSALRSRLDNDVETELHNAAEEHRKITRLRLARLIEAPQ